jgi:hypothetical protein
MSAPAPAPSSVSTTTIVPTVPMLNDVVRVVRVLPSPYDKDRQASKQSVVGRVFRVHRVAGHNPSLPGHIFDLGPNVAFYFHADELEKMLVPEFFEGLRVGGLANVVGSDDVVQIEEIRVRYRNAQGGLIEEVPYHLPSEKEVAQMRRDKVIKERAEAQKKVDATVAAFAALCQEVAKLDAKLAEMKD